METLNLKLPKALSDAIYRLHYRVHVEDYGWLGDVHKPDGSFTGTAGFGKRIEAVELYLAAPGETVSFDIEYDDDSIGGIGVGSVSFFYKTLSGQAHVQNIGWQGERKNGEIAGMSGQSLRLEAIEVVFALKGGKPYAIDKSIVPATNTAFLKS